jgi:hypothetical protein
MKRGMEYDFRRAHESEPFLYTPGKRGLNPWSFTIYPKAFMGQG